jgi:hypothetical protein
MLLGAGKGVGWAGRKGGGVGRVLLLGIMTSTWLHDI